MPILAQDVADQMRFALDAEGSDHYRDDLDIIPAINASVRWLVSVINMALGKNKLGEEIFRDLSVSRVFQTTKDSRVSLDVFPEEPWSITAVYPLPTTGNTGQAAPPPVTDIQSVWRNDLYHIRSDFDAARLTIEEWTYNRKNPFAPGYDSAEVCADIRQYAYLAPTDYEPDGVGNILREIEVRPVLNKELVTIFYIRKPVDITALNNNIDFPDSVFQLIFNKALQYIAYKQGDGTNIASITQNDIAMLLQAIS